MKLSIIVPCYNEQESINDFYNAIKPVLTSCSDEHEIIFVNDGSTDSTSRILSDLAKTDICVKVVEFSKNFGQTAAILCGMNYSDGDCVAELDCDLQDPVELLPVMVEKFKEGFEVVHGRRSKRKGESLFKKATASAYYKFLDKIADSPVPRNTGEFKLMSRRVVDEILKMPERDKYLRGLESWVGFKQTFVDFERQERKKGKTHFTLKKMAKLAADGILSNSVYPLTLSIKIGFFVGFLSVAAFVTFIVLTCMSISLPLVAWLFPTITLMFAVSFTLNGFSNAYIARTYREVRHRPEYIVANTLNCEERNEKKHD